MQDLVLPAQKLLKLVGGQTHQVHEDGGGVYLSELTHQVDLAVAGKAVDQLGAGIGDLFVEEGYRAGENTGCSSRRHTVWSGGSSICGMNR